MRHQLHAARHLDPDQIRAFSEGWPTTTARRTEGGNAGIQSISGTVTLSGGAPALHLGLRLTGGTKRVVFTDAGGHYRFDDLQARTYRIKLDASRPYLATPRSLSAVMAASDVHGADLVVTPR